MILGIFVRCCLLSLRGLSLVFVIGWCCANPVSFHEAYINTFFPKTKGIESVPFSLLSSAPTSLEEEEQENPADKNAEITTQPNTNMPSSPLTSGEKPGLKFLQRIYLSSTLQLANGVT